MVRRVYGTSRGERRDSLLRERWYVTKIFQFCKKTVMMMKIEESLFPILSRAANITTILGGYHGVIRSLILLFHVSRRSLLCWIEFKLICKQSFFTNVENDLLRT